RRSSRCAAWAWSTSPSSAAQRRSRRRRSRRSRRSRGRSSCPSASGSSASRTSARSPSGSTHTATRSTTTCRRRRGDDWRESLNDFDRFDSGIRRDGGLTHVLDKGLGPRAWEDILETSGDYIDIVKLGWGTAWITGNLRRKLEVLHGKPVVIGGT